MDGQEDSKLGEMMEGDEHDRMVWAKKGGSNQMIAQFINVTPKLTETLEDVRKQGFMESRSKCFANPLISMTCCHHPAAARSYSRLRARHNN
jgi:hypothetical protein